MRLRVLKRRRWRCVEPDCDAKTWTEAHAASPSRAVMTRREPRIVVHLLWESDPREWEDDHDEETQTHARAGGPEAP